MSRWPFIFQVCALLVISTLCLDAKIFDPSDNTYQFRSRFWPVESGHPQNAVQAVVQTPDGFLWLGTQHGLVRFDGHQFLPFDHEHLKAEKINALAVAPDGSLWVGTTSHGVFRILEGRITRYALEGNMRARVLSLGTDSDGSVWVGTVSGIFFLQGNEFSRILNDNLFATNAVRAMAQTPGGIRWFASGGQIVALSKGVPVRRLGRPDGVPSIYLRTLLVDNSGALWVDSNAGLSRWKGGRFVHFTKAHGLPDNTVSALFQDSQRRIWVGTYSGLCRKVGERFMPVLSEDGEPFDQVFAITEDQENNLWAGSKDGLIRLHEDRFKTYLTRDGLTHHNVISVLAEKEEAWVGTWGGGLHWFKDGKVVTWSKNTHPILRNDLILALCKMRDGSLWFGTDYDGGLYRLKNGELTAFREGGFQRSHAIRDIHEDRQGNLWVATSFGLILHRDDEFRRLLKNHGLEDNVIRCVAEDAADLIWAGTEGGLALWNGSRFINYTTQSGLPHNKVLSLYADSMTNLWIGTAGGLARRSDGRTIALGGAHALLSNAIVEIIEDNLGYLWLSSDRGIVRVKKQHLLDFNTKTNAGIECELFGEADGMVSSVCVGTAKPSAWKTREGRLWFATTRGLVTTDSRRTMKKNTLPPPIIVTRFSADRKSLPLDAKNVEIPPGSSGLEFTYAALSFRNPEKNKFKYKLDGFDSEWVNAGERRTAFYHNLPPGDYEFQVVGCNNDGVWNEVGATVKFTLQPLLWQTKWFQFMAFLGLAFTTAMAARHVTKRRMQARLKTLEQEHTLEKERTRIAHDMHDELGARITEILLVGKQTLQKENDSKSIERNVTRMCDAAQEIATDLNAIVFAVNPKNDTLEHLVAYIYKYVEKFLAASSVRHRLDVPVDVPHLAISSEVRHNIVMTIKEALNNSLKHAQASEISVTIKLDGFVLFITMADDGRGFLEAETSILGNGLQNMRTRMQEIGGSFAITSEPGKGTRLQMEIPLHR